VDVLPSVGDVAAEVVALVLKRAVEMAGPDLGLGSQVSELFSVELSSTVLARAVDPSVRTAIAGRTLENLAEGVIVELAAEIGRAHV
jgi:hypothetical protein